MITNHEKFKIFDEAGDNHFFIEVNWKPDDEETNNCKILKVTFPDKKQALVKKEYLNAMLFAIGTAEEQRKMIPQTLKRVKWYETTLSVKAKKDIAKGESIIFPIKITLPSIEEEAIAELKRQKSETILRGR